MGNKTVAWIVIGLMILSVILYVREGKQVAEVATVSQVSVAEQTVVTDSIVVVYPGNIINIIPTIGISLYDSLFIFGIVVMSDGRRAIQGRE